MLAVYIVIYIVGFVLSVVMGIIAFKYDAYRVNPGITRLDLLFIPIYSVFSWVTFCGFLLHFLITADFSKSKFWNKRIF